MSTPAIASTSAAKAPSPATSLPRESASKTALSSRAASTSASPVLPTSPPQQQLPQPLPWSEKSSKYRKTARSSLHSPGYLPGLWYLSYPLDILPTAQRNFHRISNGYRHLHLDVSDAMEIPLCGWE